MTLAAPFRARARVLPLALVAALACTSPPPSVPAVTTPPPTPKKDPTRSQLLDDFEDLSPWRTQSSTDVGVTAHAAPGTQGQALELAFDFRSHGGYAGVKRLLPIDFPENFELSFDLLGDSPPNDLQLKLTDKNGENVWWFRRGDFVFPKDFQRIVVRRRQIDFAWGPTRDKSLRHTDAVELVVAAGAGGGRGAIRIDNLRLTPLPPPAPRRQPIATASSSSIRGGAGLAIDANLDTAWQSTSGTQKQWLELDLGAPTEFGGLVLEWAPGAHATHYEVMLSNDGRAYRRVRAVSGGDGGRDALLLPESEARYVRLELEQGPSETFALREIRVEDLAFGATPNAFFSALAKEAPRGQYPRAFRGEQVYWTLVASDGARDSALISEDGSVEMGRGGFSVEPFVRSSAGLSSWADVEIEHSLEDGYLPLPKVRWTRGWQLDVLPFSFGSAEEPQIAVRYVLTNTTDAPLELSLVLAVRPFQVNPPTQTLNLVGGVSPIRALDWDGTRLAVNDERSVFPSEAPDHVELRAFDAGGFPERPPSALGRSPKSLLDETGFATAVLVYDVKLPPRGRATRSLVCPLVASTKARARSSPELAEDARAVSAAWREKLNRVSFNVPKSGQHIIDSLRSALAQILMSRDGPELRPGTRSYARSWIRDGAMMSEALLRLGHGDVAREYLTWYAPHQFANGQVPCCVDPRGADPVPEHDSDGELIHLAAEVQRYAKDEAMLRAMWPRVEKAVNHLDLLRAAERTAKNTTPERRALFGLLPPSISHEGYSEKPAYAYWDDFWALLGYEDAVYLAELANQPEARERIARARDEFRNDLMASIRASAKERGVDFIPGAADRGDFDPTSTTIALSPGRDGASLPRELLLETFERYFQGFEARRESETWDVYTPYELRVVGTFVRLGWRERIPALLDFFFAGQRPQGFNQWAEVVGRDAREPRFIGDMPHAWIASDYARAALDLFAHERPEDASLVLGAGLPADYFRQGFSVRDLRTPYGVLSYTVRAEGRRIRMDVKGPGPTPPGGFSIPYPGTDEPGPATLNGKPIPWTNRELRVHELPARILFETRSRPGGP